MSMIKLQFSCFLIMVFITVMYFSSKRASSKLHGSFSSILIAMPIYLVLDSITVFTVNFIPYSIVNDIAHRFFLASISVIAFMFNRHVGHLVVTTEEERQLVGNKLRKILCIVVLIVSVIYSFSAPASYVIDENLHSNYSRTVFAAGAFASVGFSIIIIGYMLASHWNTLSSKKKLAISMVLGFEIFGAYMQMFYTDFLLSSMNLTLMTLAFYLTLDNPDIALLELVEEEKNKIADISESKSAFLSIVSHEIRTPMNAIVGMTDLLLKDKDSLNEKQEKYLKNIKNSGESLVMIVNDILDQSKIEAGKMEIVEDVYNIREVLKDILLIIENRVGNKPIEVGCIIDDRIPEKLVGDSLRIRQILVNLMNNSVKYTEKGFIRVSLMVREEKQDGYVIKFSVRDSGQGIRPEDLAKIGEAYTQMDTKKNHSKEGTGLGLTISRDFIAMMGGQLLVNSEYGNGTDFFFTISQKKVTDELLNNEIQPLADDYTDPDISVMVVDDNSTNLMILEELLKQFRFKLDCAKSGQKAIELMKTKKYDIVFMDYIMPEMDGVDTTREIRRLGYTEVPIIALTGDTSTETKNKFEKAGVSDFTTKPVGMAQLKYMIAKWIVSRQ